MPAARYIKLDLTWSQSGWVADLGPEARLAWVEMLCYTKANGNLGRVRAMSTKAAARAWNVRDRAVAAMLTAAKNDGAVTEEDGFWVVTKWLEYQDTSVTRVRKWRDSHTREESGGTSVSALTDFQSSQEVEPAVTGGNVTQTDVTLRNVMKRPVTTYSTLQNSTDTPPTEVIDLEAAVPLSKPWDKVAYVLGSICLRLGTAAPTEETIRRHLGKSHPLSVLLTQYDAPTLVNMYLSARTKDGGFLGWKHIADNASAIESKMRGGNSATSQLRERLEDGL